MLLIPPNQWKFPAKTNIMDQTTLKQKIKSYIQASIQWHHEKMATISDGSIGSIVFSLEEEILIHFGLPSSAYQYSSLLESFGFNDGDINAKVNDLYRDLKNEAITYLLSSPQSDIQILKNGRAAMMHSQEVLPFLGFGVTQYSSFIYHDIFCRDLCSAEQLLEAIKIEDNNRFNHDSELIYPFATEYNTYKAYKHNCNFRKFSSILAESKSFESIYHEGSCLIIDSFIIVSFVVRNPQTCIVDIVITHDNNFLNLQIWCTIKQLLYILYHVKYRSDVASPMLALRYNNYNKGAYTFNSDRNMSMIVEVPRIDIELERLDRKTDIVKMPYSFIISYLDPILNFSI